MNRGVLCFVLLLALVACDSGAAPKDATSFNEPCGRSFQLCTDEGLIRAEILVETCPSEGDCRTEPLDADPYLEFIQLDGPPEGRCDPGDCGSALSALPLGWAPGRWRIVAPPLEGLEAPAPVIIDLEAQEVLDIEVVYTDEG